MTVDQPVQPALPDLEPSVPGALCPGCGEPLPSRAVTGRPIEYHGATCRSRARRRRLREAAGQPAVAGQEPPAPPVSPVRESFEPLVADIRSCAQGLADALDPGAPDRGAGVEAALEELRSAAAALLDVAAARAAAARNETPAPGSADGPIPGPADGPGPVPGPAGPFAGFRGGNGSDALRDLSAPDGDGAVFRGGNETPAPSALADAPAAAAPDVAGSRLRDLVDRTLAAQQDPAAPGVPASVGTDPAAPPAPSAAPGPAALAGHSARRPRLAVPRQPRLRDAAMVPDVVQLLDVRLFGDYWRLEGWSADPGIYLVTGEGHVVGSVQRDVPGLRPGWVPVYEEHFLVDAADGTVLVYDTPQDAAYIVHRVYLQRL